MGCTLSIPEKDGGIPVNVTNIPSAAPPRASAEKSSAPTIITAAPPAPEKESMEFIDNIDTYGTYKFKGGVAEPYLKAQGLPGNILDDPMWTSKYSDKVAAAVVEWCKEKGATMATHWFQPLGSAGIRRGQTGQVHNAMFNFGERASYSLCLPWAPRAWRNLFPPTETALYPIVPRPLIRREGRHPQVELRRRQPPEGRNRWFVLHERWHARNPHCWRLHGARPVVADVHPQ